MNLNRASSVPHVVAQSRCVQAHGAACGIRAPRQLRRLLRGQDLTVACSRNSDAGAMRSDVRDDGRCRDLGAHAANHCSTQGAVSMKTIQILLLALAFNAFTFPARCFADHALGAQLGTVKFEVSGKTEAQEHVVRGVKLVHHMMYPEADREFAAAI